MNAESGATVSEAVCAYLQWEVKPWPQAVPEAVRALVSHPETADALLLQVASAIADSEAVEFSDEQFRVRGSGDVYVALLRERRPDLDDDAIEALASRVYYNRVR